MPVRTTSVERYLSSFPPHAEFEESWPVQGRMRVRLSLADQLPPAEGSSSVLATVFDARGRVLFLHPDQPSGNISHLLIGGRPEAGESAEQAVVREVGEETGWRIEPVRKIGFRHFHQLEPRAEKTDRPYPDFIQPIFAARAVAFDANLIIAADRLTADLLDYARAERLTDPQHRPLLSAAAAATGHSGGGVSGGL